MQDKVQSREDLIVWQKSVTLSVAIYKLTEKFPQSELYGISSQMRRASVSIPSNIAEGRRRGTAKDFVQFLRVAHGSLAELETQLIISHKMGFCDDTNVRSTQELITEISKMLHAMIKKLG